MTHPDTLTIPRAVVEQALAFLSSSIDFRTVESSELRRDLRAALQPQAVTKVLHHETPPLSQSSMVYVPAQAAAEPVTESHSVTAYKMAKALADHLAVAPVENATPPATQAAPFNPDWSLLEATQESLREHQAALTAALEIIHLQRDWIMAVPQETQLPAMPGFDREWADKQIAQIEALGVKHG